MADSTFNLTALAERLSAEGRLQPLAGKIRRARDLASAHTDLTIALESLDALQALFDALQSDDFGRVVTESALLNNAVLLYARATKTNSNERTTFDVRSRLSPEEKVVHQELVDLRDKAIAHFGSGGSYSGVWQAEVVILQVTGSTVRPGVATRRQTVDRKLVARARKQISTTHEIFRAMSSEKLGEVADELNTISPDLAEYEIRQHPLNLDTMMASEQAADAARASAIEGGYKKGIVRHNS